MKQHSTRCSEACHQSLCNSTNSCSVIAADLRPGQLVGVDWHTMDHRKTIFVCLFVESGNEDFWPIPKPSLNSNGFVWAANRRRRSRRRAGGWGGRSHSAMLSLPRDAPPTLRHCTAAANARDRSGIITHHLRVTDSYPPLHATNGPRLGVRATPSRARSITSLRWHDASLFPPLAVQTGCQTSSPTRPMDMATSRGM